MAAALAEVLWSDSGATWKQAEQRFLVHRERLVGRNIKAAALRPEWCRHYQGGCPLRDAGGNYVDDNNTKYHAEIASGHCIIESSFSFLSVVVFVALF